MTVETYLAYLLTIAVFFATPPGPSQILMISNSLRHGTRRSLWTVAGDLSANSLQMLAAGFGLAALIATTDWALDVIKWCGVAYLLWMAVRTFMAAPKSPSEATTAAHPRKLYLQGFLTSASNPKAVFFFAALFPQFITDTAPIWPQLLALGGTYLLVDGIVLVIYGSTATRLFSRLMSRGRLLNRVSGGLMAAAAGLLALRDAEAR